MGPSELTTSLLYRPRQQRSGRSQDPGETRRRERPRAASRPGHCALSSRFLSDREQNSTLTLSRHCKQTSLFLTSLPATATEDSIRHWFTTAGGVPENKLKSVVLVSTSKVAFVNFVNRDAAEFAAAQCSVGVKVDGHPVKVQWGRSRPKKGGGGGGQASGSGGGGGPPMVVSEREIETTGK